MPHWIAFESQQPMKVNGLTYVPRQTGTNGNLTSYTIEISDDGSQWQEVKKGTLKSDASTKIIEFDEVETTHIRLVYNKAVNNNGSAAEIRLHRADVPADVQGLKTIIEDAEAMQNIGYTAASWDKLQTEIAEAKKLVESNDPDPNEIEIAKRELNDAKMKLVLKVNTTQLEALIDSCKDYTENQYTPQSWAVFVKALEAAQDLLQDNDASKDEIADAYQNLLTAISQLMEVNDKKGLQSLINQAESLDATQYTVESWNQLSQALINAKAVNEDAQASQEDIENAILALESAIADLQKVVTVEDNNSSMAKPNDQQDSTHNKGQSAQTGDQTSIVGYIGTGFAALLAIVMLKRKKSNDLD